MIANTATPHETTVITKELLKQMDTVNYLKGDTEDMTDKCNEPLDKRQIFQSSVLKTLKRLDYRTCECGCKVNIRYPCYRNDGTSFVKCPHCGRTIEAGKWKESLP